MVVVAITARRTTTAAVAEQLACWARHDLWRCIDPAQSHLLQLHSAFAPAQKHDVSVTIIFRMLNLCETSIKVEEEG